MTGDIAQDRRALSKACKQSELYRTAKMEQSAPARRADALKSLTVAFLAKRQSFDAVILTEAHDNQFQGFRGKLRSRHISSSLSRRTH
ncbi:hypothetical protein HFN63_35400 [Rhizobium leguminosarum]|uniref:hypothetical protein n=1 Tax=Rhizobium leguminosarum TaxID=384 RepID=UPI001C9804AA|nr:hypothetical protein [Rhizobium leguminosarum]MBY5775250.1 hypothetical protein [Rhizobium leguminosarum]